MTYAENSLTAGICHCNVNTEALLLIQRVPNQQQRTAAWLLAKFICRLYMLLHEQRQLKQQACFTASNAHLALQLSLYPILLVLQL